jgi:hypothetical protein
MNVKAEILSKLASLINNVPAASAHTIARSVNGELTIGRIRTLKANVLGVKYEISVADGDVRVDVHDPLSREEDYSRLLLYLINALERALQGKLATPKKLVSLVQLAGGQAAKLYEKKAIDFLTTEMDGSTLEEVRKAVEDIGGVVVEHLNATWSFEVTPLNGVRIRVSFWQGEENVPSGASVLVGQEVEEVDVPIEELVTMIEMTINRFVLFYRKETGRQPKLFYSLYF